MAVAHQRPHAAGTARIPELDGLRGLAALSVVIYHWLSTIRSFADGPVPGGPGQGTNWLFLTPLQGLVAGHQMVLLFFVLSGFVLALPRITGHGAGYLSYVRRRARRLYPVAWTALACAGLLLAVGLRAHPGDNAWLTDQLSGPVGLHDLLGTATLLTASDPGRLDGPLWSLVQEMRASLLLPVLLVVVRGCSWRLVVTLSVMLIVAGTLPSVADSTQLGTAAWSWTPVVLGCFLVGGLLARHRRALLSASDGLPRRRRRSLGLLVLISFWLPSFLRHGALACAVGNLVPVAGAALLLIVAQGTGMRRVLTAGPVAWLGAVSFPLYAFHIIVLHLLLGTSPLDVAPVAYAVLGLPLAIAIAWLIHRWVEVPLAAAPLSVGRGGAALHSATA